MSQAANRFPKITEKGSTTCASASASRSPTPSNRGATRPRATTSATTRTASATTTRCGATRTIREKTAYGSSRRPSFLFATSRIVSGYVGGLPGVHAMWAGADWTWHKPVLRNDAITTEAYLKDLVEHQTRFAGRAVQQIYHVDFYNQAATCCAEADSWCFRTERDEARERGTKYTEVKGKAERATPTSKLAEIKPLRQRSIRGATPRYWEDVKVGEALPTHVKGPMTVTGFIAYAQGWGGLYIRANKLAWKHAQASRASASRTASASPTAPSACTGTRSSRARSARPAPTTTARSAARG
jgi:hypothetical protein